MFFDRLKYKELTFVLCKDTVELFPFMEEIKKRGEKFDTINLK